MAKGFEFNYKPSKMFRDIYPSGLNVFGTNGVTGEKGKNKASLYFCGQTEINETNKNTILTRIDNNLLLTSHTENMRKYVEGDIIICTGDNNYANNVYKLIKRENYNHTYDIKFIGQIRKLLHSRNILDNIHSVNIVNTNDSSLYETCECKTPVTRSFDVSTNKIIYNDSSKTITYYDISGTQKRMDSSCKSLYNEAFNTLFGIKINPSITVLNDTSNNYDFYFRIHLKNEKNVIGINGLTASRKTPLVFNSTSELFSEEPAISKEFENCIKFNKILEFPLFVKTLNNEQNNQLPIFLTDMSCDKLHPSKNNISSYFYDGFRNIQNTTTGLYNTHQFFINRNNKKYYFSYFILALSQDTLSVVTNGDNNKNTEYLKKLWKNGTDGIFDIVQIPFKDNALSFQNSQEIIQYSKIKLPNKNDCLINYRSGESAYFSGLTPYFGEYDSSSIPSYWSDGCFQYFGSSAQKLNRYDAFVMSQLKLNKKYINDFYSSAIVDTSINTANILSSEQGNHYPFKNNQKISKGIKYTVKIRILKDGLNYRPNQDSSLLIQGDHLKETIFKFIIKDTSTYKCLDASGEELENKGDASILKYETSYISPSTESSLYYNNSDNVLTQADKEQINLRYIPESSDTIEMVNKRIDLHKKFVCDKIFDFIFNDENEYELLCVNKKTGYTQIINYKKEDII